jgi:hypothetical protein
MGASLGMAEQGVAGTAVVDYVLTLVLALATTKVTGVPLPLSTAACMVLGVVVHAAFKVDTRTARWIRARAP